MRGAREFLSHKEKLDVVIYHSPCNDGHAAAAIFANCLIYDLDFIGLHPKDNLLTAENIEKIRDKNVVFVDICFSLETMTKVSELIRKGIVLDHHITNQDDIGKFNMKNIYFHFEMDVPGCILAWRFIHGDSVKVPKAIHYIGLKDVWKHEDNQEAVFFNIAFERPKTWSEWFDYMTSDNKTNKVIEQGASLLSYQQSVLKTMAEKVEYKDWRGAFRVAVINAPYPWISDLGALLCKDEKTIAIIWNKTLTGSFSLSFRSHNKVGPDVASIAKELEGGGHTHAAAARIETWGEFMKFLE